MKSMSLISTFNHFSYKKIISLGFLFALTLSIPTTILLVQQQTKISSSAHIEKPVVIPRPKKSYGEPAQKPIQVNRVYPFLGKVGDELVILGENFGTNPQIKSLSIGGINLTENDIDVWQDNMISAFLPSDVQSGFVEIQSGSFKWISKTPFTIYNEKTTTQIKKSGQTLIIVSPTVNINKITYSMINEPEAEIKAKLDANNTFSFSVPEGEINHVALFDSTASLIPFYVNPIEFDF